MSLIRLGCTCAACGRDRKQKVIMYDPATLLPYCPNPYMCVPDHPNHAQNIIKNQREMLLINHQEATELHRQNLLKSYSPEHAEKIQRLLAKPITFRIHDPEMAQFLLDLQEDSFPDMASTIRHCIEIVKQHQGPAIEEGKALVEKQAQEQRTEQAAKEIETEAPDTAGDDMTF